MAKQNNIVRALLFVLILSLIGAVVFCIVLYNQVWLDWKWGSLACIAAAGSLYLIPIKKPKFYHVIIGVIWCAIWFFVFHFVALLIYETITYMQIYSENFRDSFIGVLNLWKRDVGIKAIFEHNFLTLMWYAINGSVINLICLSFDSFLKVIRNKSKTTKNKCYGSSTVFSQNNNPPQVIIADGNFFGEEDAEYIVVYKRVLNLCKQALLEYNEDEDKNLLDRKIEKIKKEIIFKQTAATRQLVNAYAQKELGKDLMKLDKHANEIIADIA